MSETTAAAEAADQEPEADRLGGGVRRADRAGVDPLVRRLGGGVRPPLPGAGRQRHLREALGREAAEFLPGPLRPGRRRQGRGPNLHLLGARGRRRADQQLARSGRDARRPQGAVQGLDARSHDVRGPVLDGPARVAHRPHRRPAHRLRLRGRLDADHDPDGQGRPRRARRRWRLRPLPALARRAARRRPGGRAVALRRRQQVHRPLPGDARDLVLRLRLRRQRAARQEVLRAADRLGDGPRRGLAGRAHADPQAHLARGRGQVRRRRLPVGLRARPTWRC